ncbi:hypothetical protein PF003_g406 [Phytophthora fragariae]|nr:hypothetical protein PF003_g406 [Phytophthora fragariae]
MEPSSEFVLIDRFRAKDYCHCPTQRYVGVCEA